jgi:hypothetical protein
MEPLQVLQAVVSTLERLGIPSMLVGSFASSSYSLTRITQDADLIVKLNQEHIDEFVQAFSDAFFVDRGLIEQALKRRSSFNIIHLETTFKVDFFVMPDSSYGEEEFSRRTLRQLDPRIDFITYVQTAEDVVLSKLDWFRQGGGASENQWRDVTGILKAQAGRLDIGYLQKWAAELGVTELLERARHEAETQPGD